MDKKENLPSSDIDNLWRLYSENKSIPNRNLLFDHYAPWIKKVASSLFLKYRSPNSEWRDFMQNASVALIECIDRFKLDHGVPFEGFAYKRIKGAILNNIADRSLEASHFSDYSDSLPLDDIDGEIGFDQFLDVVIGAAFAQLLDSASHKVMNYSIDPLDSYTDQEQEKNILSAVEQLDDPLKYVLQAHYLHFMSFVQIADTLSLSRSRVSQLHCLGLRELRSIYELNFT